MYVALGALLMTIDGWSDDTQVVPVTRKGPPRDRPHAALPSAQVGDACVFVKICTRRILSSLCVGELPGPLSSLGSFCLADGSLSRLERNASVCKHNV